MTTKTLLLGLALSASLMACGGKAKPTTTTPDNTTGTTETQPATEGSAAEAGALGGTTYGGATAPAGGGADPCGQ